MARKRMISPEFWTDEKVGLMPVEARLLFMGLISNADDTGRLPGNALLVKSMIFPYDNYTINKIDEWLKLLCQQKIIIRYKVDSQTYIQVVNFLKHQTINRPTTSKIPAFTPCVEDSLRTHGGLTEDSLLIEDNIKEVKLKEKKLSYAEFVSMAEEEHKKLIEQFGEQGTKSRIENLNLYKGSTGKKYQSDYLTILSWERKNKGGVASGAGTYSRYLQGQNTNSPLTKEEREDATAYDIGGIDPHVSTSDTGDNDDFDF